MEFFKTMLDIMSTILSVIKCDDERSGPMVRFDTIWSIKIDYSNNTVFLCSFDRKLNENNSWELFNCDNYDDLRAVSPLLERFLSFVTGIRDGACLPKDISDIYIKIIKEEEKEKNG